MTRVIKTARSSSDVPSSSHRGLDPRPSLTSILSGIGRRATQGLGGKPAKRVIKLKSPREISLMREAGRVVAKALDKVRQMAVPGVTTADMEETVAAVFREHDATPLFLGYPSPDQGKAPVSRRGLRQRQSSGSARHPQSPALEGRRDRLDRHRLQGGWMVRRLRDHAGHRRGRARRPEATHGHF